MDTYLNLKIACIVLPAMLVLRAIFAEETPKTRWSMSIIWTALAVLMFGN